MSSRWLKELFPEGDMAFFRDSAAGTYKGFGISVKKKLNSVIVKMAGDTSQISSEDFKYWTGTQEKKSVKLIKQEKTPSYIELECRDFATKAGFINGITGLADDMAAFLKGHNVKTCCEACGKNMPYSFFYIGEEPFLLCDGCGKEKEEEVESAFKEYKGRKAEIFPGILGAFLGSLPGAALWTGIIIYGLYNGLAGTAGIVVVIGAILGCRFFGKGLTGASVIEISIVSLIAMIVSNHITFTWVIYDLFARFLGAEFWKMMPHLNNWMSQNYIFETFIPGVSSYWVSLSAGVIMGIITGLIYFAIHRCSVKRKYEFKQVFSGK